jgi:hypothetical protein
MADSGATSAPEPPGTKHRFLIAFAKLLGVKPLEHDPLSGTLISDGWHFEESLDAILIGGSAVALTFDRFNSLMLHVRRGVVGRPFYETFFAEVTTIDEFEAAVEKFRTEAMWLFGNFKFAFRTFAACSGDELAELLHRPALAPPPDERDTFTEIEPIPQDDLWLLGYVSSEVILFLQMASAFVAQIVGGADPAGVFRAVTDRRAKLVEACQRATVSLTFDGDVPKFDPADLTDVKRRLDETHAAYLKRTENARTIGLRNTRRYLALPYLDVYVATSMRTEQDFVDQSKFIEQVFGDARVAALKLRFFDPTLSYVDDRITKGLIECLMLRRSKVTIYNAGATDSLGKDSELAATLAQGKPVIVYVPPGLETRAKVFRADHPLGLQMAVSSGVAHGILVVRSAAQCAAMLHALLHHELSLEIRHEGGNYQLVERETESILRVVSDDPFLTHAFWTFFHGEASREFT